MTVFGIQTFTTEEQIERIKEDIKVSRLIGDKLVVLSDICAEGLLLDYEYMLKANKILEDAVKKYQDLLDDFVNIRSTL